MAKNLYAFKVEKKFVPRKRMCIYVPVELLENIKESAREQSERENKKISANQLVLRTLKANFLNEEV